MKILIVADVKPDLNAGASGTEIQTVYALRKLGHDVDTIWSDDIRHRISHGNLHYILELPWAYRDAIGEKCKEKVYDVIHVNQPYAWLAARDHQKLKRTGVFVVRSHGWEPRIGGVLKYWRRKYRVPEWKFPRGILGRPIRSMTSLYCKWCVSAADGIIVSCSEDREYIIQTYQAKPDKVANILQAPSEEFLLKPVLEMTDKRSTKLLYAGQASFFKAPHVLAEIWNHLAAHHPSLSFTWCCPETDHDKCKELLSPSTLERTTFVDWIPQNELVDLYDRHGIFLFPSYTEGFGKVFIEAMARGLCVVASNAAGMKDVIQHGKDGFLCEPGNASDFVEKVNDIFQNDRNHVLSQNAAAKAREYTWEKTALETLKFYDQINTTVNSF